MVGVRVRVDREGVVELDLEIDRPGRSIRITSVRFSRSKRSPSPGRLTIGSMGGSYDVHLARCLSGPRRCGRRAAFRSGAWHRGARHRSCAVRRAARALGLLVPRRRVAARRAGGASGRARLRRARAHRPRRRLRLARVRTRGEALRCPPDHRRRGDDRRRRTSDAALRDAGRLREPLPHPHRRARRNASRGKGARELLPAATTIEYVAAHAEGLVCLSGCARHGLATLDPNGAARLARGVSRRVLRRAPAAVRARRRAPQRAARRSSPRILACRPSRPATSTRTISAAPSSRTRSSRSATAPRSTAASASGAATTRPCCSRRPRCSSGCRDDAALRTREVADRCRFDLTQELGYRYPDFSDGPDPADVQLRAICDRAFAERYADANGHKRRARERLDDELRADRAGSASRGFFLLHWEVLELARECALEVRGPGTPRHALPPGRGRGSSVGSIVCYLTGLSHVDPVEAKLSLGRFLNDEMAAVPDIDLDFPRDIREKLIVARHRALRPRARRARRELRDLPQPRRDPRRRQGARPAVRRARAARARHRRLGRDARRRGARRRPRRRTRARAGTRSAS